MYKVIKYFTDLHDNCHPYNVGDEFPRKGIEVTQERFDELAGNKNKQGVPLIALVEEKSAEADGQAEASEPAEAAEEKAPEKKPAKRGTKKAAE